jgi:hypothetical protein
MGSARRRATRHLRLLDIIETIEHIRGEIVGVALDAFGADWQALTGRTGVEIISEASRHLTDELEPGLELLPNWGARAKLTSLYRRTHHLLK